MNIARKNRYDFLDEFPKNRICAELGVFKGDFTTHILTHVFPKKLHLVDIWRLAGHSWGGMQTETIYQTVAKKYAKEIESKQVEMNECNDLEFLRELPDDYFDWVYVDSTHMYAHTKSELEILKDKVKDSGFIAGHDWNPNPKHRHHGVYKAVIEFVEQYGYELAIVDNHLQWSIKKRK